MALKTRLKDLSDFNTEGLNNNFIIVYNQSTDSFETIDADTLISNSLIDGALPNDFIEEVTDSISVDGGEGF